MMEEPWRGFASDNYAGVHPQVLDRLADVNIGHQSAYGDDAVTARAADMVRDLFGQQAQFLPVFNGTGANVVSLQALTKRWQSVICSGSAHIHADEGGPRSPWQASSYGRCQRTMESCDPPTYKANALTWTSCTDPNQGR